MILAIMALGLNISFGMAGVVDIGYITFVATGAYIGGVTALGPANASQQLNYILGLHLPWPIPLLLGAVAAAALGGLVATVAARRLRSDYQAIVMVATWSIAIDIVGHSSLFNGQIGLYNVPQPFANTIAANNYVWIFDLVALPVLALVILVSLRLQTSGFGRAMRGCRDDPDLTASLGQSTFRIRLKAMSLAGAAAGLAGGLYVEYLSAWNTSGWLLFEVVAILAAVVIGGRGRTLGILIGAILVRFIFASITFIPALGSRPQFTADIREVAIGVLFIAALLLRPHGILQENRSAHPNSRRLVTVDTTLADGAE